MINIKDTFLKLTERRYPHGTEDLSMDVVKEILPNVTFNKDEVGNYYIYIPKLDGSDSDVMFTSHLDTIDSGKFATYSSTTRWDSVSRTYIPIDEEKARIQKEEESKKLVHHIIEGDFIKTDGDSNLGADDKAGTTIMLYMIEKQVPGLYYFFIGEESGCIGSSGISRIFDKQEYPTMNKCIAFDRRGYDSIITRQNSSICCSDDFARELANRYNEYGFWFKPDPTGIYTDSAEFTDIIPECSNISVGYFSEHTKSEKQDFDFLELLAIVSAEIDWETLPIVREKNIIYNGKKSKITYGRGYYYGDDWGEEYGEYTNRHRNYDHTPTLHVGPAPNVSTNNITEKNTNLNITETDEHDFENWYLKQKEKITV